MTDPAIPKTTIEAITELHKATAELFKAIIERTPIPRITARITDLLEQRSEPK